MRFYDANLSFGINTNVDERPLLPCPTMADLETALRRAGVSGGLVRMEASDSSGAVLGNRLLKEALAGVREDLDLYGMYTVLPSYTHETPPPAELPAVMREGKFAALRLAPSVHHFMAKPGILADILTMAADRKIPVMFDTACGIAMEEIYDIMERFPGLTAILAYNNIWPTERLERPFLASFENLRLDLSMMIIDQGIEGLVQEYGSSRLLFGSRFPAMYIGGAMLQLRYADISDEDKEAIAGRNLLAMIKGAAL
jgi:predicted TIM-barrel fold metal-dependent hydrolase